MQNGKLKMQNCGFKTNSFMTGREACPTPARRKAAQPPFCILHSTFCIARSRLRERVRGFTLVEMVLAMSILGVITLLVFFTFDAALNAWRAGSAFSERISHADFVMDQVSMGLRSAFYPDARNVAPEYGFQIQDNGNDSGARDMFSWTKIGTALVGEDAPYAGTPHRIEVGMYDVPGGGKGFGYRAWRQDFNVEDFDAGKIEPIILSEEIIGVNCRMLDPDMSNDPDADLEWIDDWEGSYSNRLPRVVEITLYVENPEKDRKHNAKPIAISRLVTIPVAYISWGEKPQDQPRRNPPGGGGGGGSNPQRPGGGGAGGGSNPQRPSGGGGGGGRGGGPP